jgi:quinol monooxygenase YgiN
VTWRLASGDPVQRQADARFVIDSLEGLVGKVPTLDALTVSEDVGVTAGNWDLVLVADYASHDALDRYQEHPDHLAVVAQIKPLLASRASVDFEA